MKDCADARGTTTDASNITATKLPGNANKRRDSNTAAFDDIFTETFREFELPGSLVDGRGKLGRPYVRFRIRKSRIGDRSIRNSIFWS